MSKNNVAFQHLKTTSTNARVCVVASGKAPSWARHAPPPAPGKLHGLCSAFAAHKMAFYQVFISLFFFFLLASQIS
jgi:hypothetical protein